MRLALILVALAACADDGAQPAGGDDVPALTPAQLADVAGLKLLVFDNDYRLPGDARTVTVAWEYPFVSGVCYEPVPALTVTIAGVAAAPDKPAGWHRMHTPDDGDYFTCEWPTWTVPAPDTAASPQVEVRDDSLALTGDLGDAFAPRTATHPTWTFHRGESSVIAWSSAGDLANATRTDVFIEALDNIADIVRLTAGAAPDGIHVTVPADAQTKSGTLQVQVISEGTCGDRCTYHFGPIVEHAATIAP